MFRPVLQETTSRSPNNIDPRYMTANFLPGIEAESLRARAPFKQQNTTQFTEKSEYDDSKKFNKSEFSINYERTQKDIKE